MFCGCSVRGGDAELRQSDCGAQPAFIFVHLLHARLGRLYFSRNERLVFSGPFDKHRAGSRAHPQAPEHDWTREDLAQEAGLSRAVFQTAALSSLTVFDTVGVNLG